MQPEFNTEHSDLSGSASVTFANGITLDDFCAQHIPTYNRDRLQAIAVRLFEGNETVITVYALDKMRQFEGNSDAGKIPVKKFKLDMLSVKELFSYCGSFNCTLTTGAYPVEEMEVINK
jgi:hypothetical protein